MTDRYIYQKLFIEERAYQTAIDIAEYAAVVGCDPLELAREELAEMYLTGDAHTRELIDRVFNVLEGCKEPDHELRWLWLNGDEDDDQEGDEGEDDE